MSDYEVNATGSEAKHIIDLLKAEADGRLVVLPCKVGDTVYVLLNNSYGIQETKVNRIAIIGGKIKAITGMICINNGAIEWSFEPSDIGKIVFLTREVAEKALKGEIT